MRHLGDLILIGWVEQGESARPCQRSLAEPFPERPELIARRGDRDCVFPEQEDGRPRRLEDRETAAGQRDRLQSPALAVPEGIKETSPEGLEIVQGRSGDDELALEA